MCVMIPDSSDWFLTLVSYFFFFSFETQGGSTKGEVKPGRWEELALNQNQDPTISEKQNNNKLNKRGRRDDARLVQLLGWQHCY